MNIIKPVVVSRMNRTYLWDGKALKPAAGLTLSNIWTFDGKYLKRSGSPDYTDSYIWDGRELKPKSVSSQDLTYIWDGEVLRPRYFNDLKKVWIKRRKTWELKHSYSFLDAYEVVGEIPVPVCAVVLFDLV